MTRRGCPQRHWSADHVYISPGRMSDRFLLRIAAPLLRDLAGAGNWFFIRYGEGGPHLRIRVAVDDPAVSDRLHECWRQAAPRHVDAAPLAIEWRSDDAPEREPGSVHRIAYEPEVARYGGPRAMASNERLFCQSTSLALGIIGATLGDADRRIGQAIKIMIASVRSFADDPAEIGEIFRRYAAGWRSFLAPTGWTPDGEPVALSDPHAIEAALLETPDERRSYSSAWRGCLAALIAALDADDAAPLTASKPDIVMSQLHMFCNRLGLSPAMEFHLATAIARVLQHGA